MRDMHKVSSLVSRIFFIIAFILAVLAVWEKLFSLMGTHFLVSSKPITIMQTAGVMLLFVICLQLHDMRETHDWRNGNDQ